MRRIVVLSLMILCWLTGCGHSSEMITATYDSDKIIEPISTAVTTLESHEIYVYVCGHVKTPGVYTLFPESRVCDAIEAAGGLLNDADGESLNQAERVVDGQRICVPGIGEKLEDNSENDGKVNINLATKEELMTLPGIGESKALLIIEYREEHGAFECIEDLMTIPGIKEGVFNKMKEYIKIS